MKGKVVFAGAGFNGLAPAWRGVTLLALALGIAAWHATAQTPPQRPGAVPPATSPRAATDGPKASLQGVVLRQATGEPLRKARVALRKAESPRGESPLVVTTGADGRFELRDIEPGRYRLSVERNGYFRQEYGQRGASGPGTILTLESGQRMRDVTFRLLPAAVITGRVYDEDGEVLQGVQVSALRYSYRQGQRELMPTGGAATNDLGEYRIYGLAPGRYFLSARRSPAMAIMTGSAVAFVSGGMEQTDLTYLPTYYPGTADPARATPLEVAAGDELRGMDFTCVPTEARRVRGRVFNAITGQPARGTPVQLVSRREGEIVQMMFSPAGGMAEGPDGNFELRGVAPGKYTLMAVWMDEGRVHLGRRDVDVETSDVEALQVVILPGVEITGRVEVQGGVVPAGELRLFLQSEAGFGFGSTTTSVRPDHTFSLSNVSEDTYRLNLAGLPPDYYLKSVRYGRDDVTERSLRVVRGQNEQLEIIISAAGARIEGVVLTEEQLPASGALVTLVPESERRGQFQLYKTTVTDQFGRFLLRGVAPGKYKLFAWEQIEPGAHQDNEFLRPYEEKGREVSLTEGGLQTVELRVIPATQGSH